MPEQNTSPNGGNRLEEAMALLIQNQAAFVGQFAESNRRLAEYERQTAERFARIEAQIAEVIRVLNDHTQVLAEHTRIMERLPEAVREKIGFKGQV